MGLRAWPYNWGKDCRNQASSWPKPEKTSVWFSWGHGNESRNSKTGESAGWHCIWLHFCHLWPCLEGHCRESSERLLGHSEQVFCTLGSCCMVGQGQRYHTTGMSEPLAAPESAKHIYLGCSQRGYRPDWTDQGTRGCCALHSSWSKKSGPRGGQFYLHIIFYLFL